MVSCSQGVRIITDYPDVVSSWNQPQDKISAEEEETSMPCSFTGPMYYLSKPYVKVLEDYTKMHMKQAAPYWYAGKKFRNFYLQPE